MSKRRKSSPPRISDAAVKRATGKTLPEWFKILDRLAESKTHTERAKWLYDHYLNKGWWCQMVTVTYEQARGLRKVNETTAGFQIGVSRVFGVPMSKLFRAWKDDHIRNRWLKHNFEITTANANKSIRARWNENERIDMNFYGQGSKKSQVSLGHRKLPNAKAAARAKEFWAGAMDRLRSFLE